VEAWRVWNSIIGKTALRMSRHGDRREKANNGHVAMKKNDMVTRYMA
jgi:hypothetical protein